VSGCVDVSCRVIHVWLCCAHVMLVSGACLLSNILEHNEIALKGMVTLMVNKTKVLTNKQPPLRWISRTPITILVVVAVLWNGCGIVGMVVVMAAIIGECSNEPFR
jgi:hypothetical protein